MGAKYTSNISRQDSYNESPVSMKKKSEFPGWCFMGREGIMYLALLKNANKMQFFTL